jgi:two-component system cell cycle sensor histidine kinase/response regulator CckA
MNPLTNSLAASGMPAGTETVLVVDDNHQVTSLAANVLRALGYRVICAPDGRTAGELPAEVLATVDLVIADVMMPRLHGPALIEWLGERDLHPAVIYTSSFLDAPNAGTTADGRQTLFLPKPWGPQALALATRRALDANAATR